MIEQASGPSAIGSNTARNHVAPPSLSSAAIAGYERRSRDGRKGGGDGEMNLHRADTREPRPNRLGWLGRSLLAASAIAGLAFVAGFGWFANQISHLETPADPPRADAIIVLTGGQFRLDAALDLLRSGKGRRLLISGVNPVARDSELKAVMGADDRLFSCCIDIDRAAIDTIGNAAESAKWVNEHAYSSVILVTNNYHMPRSLLEMRRLLKTTELRPYPVVNSRLDDGSWLVKPDAVRVLFTEYTKFLTAVARNPFVGTLHPTVQTRSANAD
jgi:uncharacterized SAM-binding protein YcdF (DUF218 family)